MIVEKDMLIGEEDVIHNKRYNTSVQCIEENAHLMAI